MAREDREAWERLEAEAADEAYMQELRRQQPELMEAERAIFAGTKGDEVITLSSDNEVEGGEDGGLEGGELSISSPMPRSKAARTAARRASRWAARTRRSTSTSGGVPSLTTPMTAPARTRLVAHRT